MTKDDLVRMVREAGLAPICEACDEPEVRYAYESWDFELERFAALVAAAEREACAKVCDQKVDAEYATGKVDHNEMGWTQACAIAIRARGAA
jgi:hypothetical protein